MVKSFISDGMIDPNATLTEAILDDIYGNYAEDDRLREHFIEYLQAMDNKWTMDASSKLSLWKDPAFLLWGIEDDYQPSYVSGVALAQIMPHAHWKHVDASHYYPLEVPEAVVDAFVTWNQG